MSVSSPVPKVLLVEGNISGHRLFYIRLLAMEAVSRGYSVHLATARGASETPEFRAHLNDCRNKIMVSELPDLRLETIKHLSRQLKADRTIIPDGDAVALQLAVSKRWQGHGKLSVLIMRENAQPDVIVLRRAIKQLAKLFVMLRVHHMRNVDLAILKSATWSGSSWIKVALDPVEITCTEANISEVRLAWTLDPSRYWFAVLGAITERKNLPLILRCLSDLAPGRYGLLIAGRVEASVGSEIESAISQLNRAAIPVVVVDRLLSDLELDTSVAAVDCLILAHSNEGPSGLLGKAACVGTRVIAAGANSLRRDVASLGLAAEWTKLSRREITEAMRRAASSNTPIPHLGATSKSFTDALLVPHELDNTPRASRTG